RGGAAEPAAGAGGGVGVGPGGVVRPLDRAPPPPRLLQPLHVPGDRRLRHPQAARRLADRHRPAREPLDDRPPSRVGQRPERIVSHYANYTRRAASGQMIWAAGSQPPAARAAWPATTCPLADAGVVAG